MNTQSIWSYLKCLYLVQNFQRFGNLVVPKNLGFPKNQKKQKTKKNNFPEVFALEASAERVLTYFFCFCFLFFGNPRFFGTTKFPNLWKIVFFGISEYSKHLVLSEMSLSVAKVTEKHLQIIVSIWCKISRKKHLQINGKPHSQGHPFCKILGCCIHCRWCIIFLPSTLGATVDSDGRAPAPD